MRCIQDQEEAAHDAAMARLARSFFHHHSQPSATPGPGSKPVSAMTNDELLMSMANDDYAVREAGHVELLRRVMSKDPLTVAKAILSIAEALKSPDAELVARGRNIRFEIHQHGAHNLFSCLRKRLKMGGLDKGETNLITETLSVLKSNDIEGFFVPDDLPE